MIADEIYSVLKSILPETDHPIPLHEPKFPDDAWHYVKECLDTNWVSYAGSFVKEFDRALAEVFQVKHVICVVSGTAALHMCLLLAGVRPNDEVLMPSLTFVASANAVHYCQAIPHFVECSKENLGIDVVKLRSYLENIVQLKNNEAYNAQTGRRIKALLPVHIFGHPVDMDPLNQLAKEFHLTVIEDVAESLGSLYKGESTGNFSLLAATSFNGNKILTTGGGGAILTNDDELAQRARHLTTTAKIPHPYEFYHDEVGYNYRLPNLNAALGCAQLKHITTQLKKKRQLAMDYQKAFQSLSDIEVLTEPPFATSNYWLNAILLKPHVQSQKKAILEFLNDKKILARGIWTPMHQLPAFKDCPKMDLILTEQMHQCVINLPSSPHLVKEIYA